MPGVDHPARRLTALVAACGFFDLGLAWVVLRWVGVW